MKQLLLAAAIHLCITGFSQTKTIKGTVYYEETKEPVPFAYVKLRDIAFGTITDHDGTFSLQIPEKYFNEVLQFTYVGLKTHSLNLKDYTSPVKIYLKTDITELYTVVVSAKRESNPKVILKRALKAVKDNYINESFTLKGYYREYVTENDRPVKYADASVQLDLEGYSGKMEKKKAYENPVDLADVTTIGSWSSRTSSLHRWHFHQKVLKGERAKIIDSKSSDDLNSTRMYANIQGGPLSALTKDKVKYPANFMDNLGKYEYELVSVMKNEEEYYLINFKPEISPEKLKDKKRSFNYEFKLGGSVLIKKSNDAIEEITYSVPPEYKQYICGYRGWNVRHFDFSVKAVYEKTNQGYVLSYLKHSDEFIIEDTLANRKIPYAAISEFFAYDPSIGKSGISKDENFANSDYNYLFDHPDEYHEEYWKEYEVKHPYAKLPPDLYSQMSADVSLEKQFASKLTRDTSMTPPIAQKLPSSYEAHGKNYQDDYAWLKDTKNPLGNEAVMQHLAAENAYTENYFKPLKPLRRELFKELKSYVEDDFTSLPIKENGYSYYYRLYPNNEYPVYYRKEIGADSTKAEILFDVNKMAADHDGYYNLTGIDVSPNTFIAAFMENTTGNDRWVLRFKDLRTGEILSDQLEYVGDMEWINDEEIAFTDIEKKTFRSGRLYSYNLKSKERKLIYQEEDKTYSISLSKSLSKEFLFMTSYSSDETETWFLSLKNLGGWKLIAPRREKHRYNVSHFEDKFYIVTNHKAINNKLMVTDTSRYAEKYWKEEVGHKEDVEIISILPFKKWMVFQERHGLDYKLRVVNKQDGKEHYVKSGGHAAVYLGQNLNFDTDTLQINRSDFRYPSLIMNYHMESKKFKMVKTAQKFTPITAAKTEVVYAKSHDGKEIPITLIYLKHTIKTLEKEGKKPTLFISGYGSYGSRNTPAYNPWIYPLLQKGVVYAIAHVRGGGDLGDGWYLDGKLLNKKNTFTDFIDCTEYLIKEGYGEKGKVIAQGGSAGGLLMGAIANMRPELFKLIILDVPFVDVINTMMDDKLPLTTGEYNEWGNPAIKKYFNYIQSYSPYDNVEAKDYPNMLFLTAINDSRVGYWEPSKMVAKLRQLKTDDNEVMLKTNFSAGHGGASGRYEALVETAFKYALILELMK